MQKIKISVVSYLNSKPFIYGIEHSDIRSQISLQLDMPSLCAQNLIDGSVDIGLIPVAVIPLLKEHYIISDYCIGAEGRVASVILYSDVPLGEITSVLLDYQSRSSVTLVKVLAENYWKISPQWTRAEAGYEQQAGGTTAAVIIGDRTFGLEGKFRYAYDLAGEWQKFTGLPFVFACWVANKKLPDDFIAAFNEALKTGLARRPELIAQLKAGNSYNTDIETYLTKSISYDLSPAKKQALALFLDYVGKLKQ